MAESFIQLPIDSTGKMLRTETVVPASNTVHMEVHVIGDPTTSGNLANVTAAGALKVDGSAVTQPISGSVSVTGTVAVTQSTSPWVTSDNHFTHNLNQDGSGNVGVNVQNTVTVTGTITANAGTGTFNTQDAADVTAGTTTAPNKVLVVAGKTADVTPAYDPLPLAAGGGSVVVSGTVSVSGTTTVSGTVTANQGSPPWTVKPDGTSWTLTGTSANVDVTNTVTVSGTVTANAGSGTFTTSDSHFPASVALADNLANPTTTEVGANMLGWDATNTVWRRVQVDAGTGTLKVDPGTVTVTGTVTSNQGGAPWTVKPDGTAWALTGTSANVDVTNTVTVSGTVTANQGGAPWAENITQFGSNAVVTGTGASGLGIPRVTVSNDSVISSITNAVTVSQATAANLNATVTGTVSVNALPTGSNTIGKVDILGNTGAVLDTAAGTPNSQALTIQGNSSGVAVPISAASLPLPANAAQETGGNLALIATATIFQNQVVDVLSQILAAMDALNLNIGSCTVNTPVITREDVLSSTSPWTV